MDIKDMVDELLIKIDYLRNYNEVLDMELDKIDGKVKIGHCFNENAANTLKALIESEFGKIETKIYRLHGLCSFYAEKGGLLLGFEVK